MSFTTDELLLAAQVSETARWIREAKRPKHSTVEERDEWNKENPSSNFIPQAVAHLKGIALLIRPLINETPEK